MYDEFYKKNLVIGAVSAAAGVIIVIVSLVLMCMGKNDIKSVVAIIVGLLLISVSLRKLLDYPPKFRRLQKLF